MKPLSVRIAISQRSKNFTRCVTMFGLRQVRLLQECSRAQQRVMIQRLRSVMATSADIDVANDDVINGEISTKEYRSFEEIPGPKGLPFIGSLLDYTSLGPYKLERMHLAVIDRFRQYGPIFKETIGDNTYINIIDAEDVEHLFRNAGKTPARPPIAPLKHYREMKKNNIGIASLQGEDWAKVRKPVQQVVMKPQSVQAYIPALEKVSDDFIELMKTNRRENGEIDNYQNELYKWALEGVCTLALNTRLGCVDTNTDGNSDAQQMIDATLRFFSTLRDLTFSFPLYKFGIYTKTWKTFADCHDTFLKIAEKYINKTLEELDLKEKEGKLEEEADQPSLLSYLLSKKSLTFDELLMIPVDLMQAGIDTTSHTIVFNLYLLATNPEVQEKVYQEVSRTLTDGEPITVQTLQRLPYLKACIKETHRMMPTIDGTTRIPDKDIVLSGYHIPANSVIRTHCIAGCMEEYFPDQHIYKPERWLRKDCKINPHLLLPFGSGSRMCIGRRFAEQEIQILLAKLIKAFRIEWHHQPMTQLFQLLNAPDVPAQFTFIDRRQ
ncbi:probable cytochrome P450 49a1 isoform X2 [Ptychodera flava]|uniref:probable cytochrome P450 49a1 isoform X2 n=1 Tax=Ptychodera flava TaxID=63121 RepID=UPI00396A7A8C